MLVERSAFTFFGGLHTFEQRDLGGKQHFLYETIPKKLRQRRRPLLWLPGQRFCKTWKCWFSLENVTTSHGWASPVIKIGGVVLAHSLRAFKLQYYLASDKILLWWHSSSSLSHLPEWTKKADCILVVDFTKTLSIHRENYVTRIDLKKQSFVVDLRRRILWRNDFKLCLALTLLDLATAVPGKISDMMMGKLCSLPPMMAIPRSSAGFFSIIACFPRLVVWEKRLMALNCQRKSRLTSASCSSREWGADVANGRLDSSLIRHFTSCSESIKCCICNTWLLHSATQ